MEAEDALAMLQAAVGEEGLTTVQKSHILTMLGSSHLAAYDRLFASNASQIEDSENSRKALRMPIRTFKPDVQPSPGKSHWNSQDLVPRTFSSAGSLEELSHTKKLPHIT